MELLDVYNNEGKVTGKIVTRGTKKEEFNNGEYIGIAQLFIENDEGKFLLEKNAKNDGFKYLPVGGHIISNETPKEAIIRETKEEIGIDIKEEDIKELGFVHIDFPIRFLYYIKKNINLDDLNLQKEEVADVTYKSATEIYYLIEKGEMHPVHSDIIPKVLSLRLNNKK